MTREVTERAQARALLVRLALELGSASDAARALDCSSLERVAATLRLPRHLPRMVELDEASLSLLALPALLVVKEGLAVVRAVSRCLVSIELPGGGRRELTRARLLAESGHAALELTPCLRRSGSFVSRLCDFLSVRRRSLVQMGSLSLLLGAVSLIPAYTAGLVIDRALPERTPKLLALLTIASLLVTAQRALLVWLERRTALVLEGRLDAAVSASLFDHLLRIPLAAHAGTSVGGWLETLSGAKHVQKVVTSSALVPLLRLGMALVYATALLREGPRLTLAVVAASTLLMALQLCFVLRATQLERSLIEASAKQQSALIELLGGVATLRLAGALKRRMGRLFERVLDARGGALAIERTHALARLFVGSAREGLGIATFTYAAQACLAGEMTVGQLMTVTMLADRLIDAVAGLSGVIAPVLSARPHAQRVDELLAREDVTTPPKQACRAPLASGDAVVLEDVWFRYGPDRPWVLSGANLHVRRGERSLLSGPSGMGKSTILRLIAGLYEPERGRVRVFGMAPRERREQIGYLPQDATLFQGSILQNLVLLSRATRERVYEAAEQTGLAAWVTTLPMGYETLLPAGAANLSGGQRQLLAWTAAMASRRELLLLDEPLSQVDRLQRARLLVAAREAQRTIVTVEHDVALAGLGERAPADSMQTMVTLNRDGLRECQV